MKKRSLLSHMMYMSPHSYEFPKRNGIAGENNDEAKGEAKSFPFMVRNSTDEDLILKFFEDLNDVRYYVWQEVKKGLGKLEQLDDENILQFLKPAISKTDGLTSTDITNAWTKILREITAKVVKKHSPLFDHLNQGKLPYWISYDLHPKISSYLSLIKKAGGDSKKDLFDTWQTSEDGFLVNLEVFNLVTKAGLKTWSQKKAQEALIAQSIKVMKSNKYFEVDTVGKIKRIHGHEGVKAHNILVRQINMLVGSYLGQLTNHAIEVFSKEVGKEFKNKREVWAFIKMSNNPSFELRWKELCFTNIKKLQEIKKYPSPPSFYLASYFKEPVQNKIPQDFEQRYKELLNVLRSKKFDLKRSCVKILRLEESTPLEELKAQLIELKEKEQSNSVLAHKKRILRHLIYKGGISSMEDAVHQEITYLARKVENLIYRSKHTSKKIQQLSAHVQKLLRLELNSRDYTDPRQIFELDLEIKKLCGDLQMSTLRIKPYKQFSFQFRNYDQAALYPSFIDKGERFQFFLTLNATGERDDIGSKEISYFELKEGGKLLQRSGKIKGKTLEIPVHFGKRIGRKFIFNSKIGFSPKVLEGKSDMPTKLGTPNFYLRYPKGLPPEIRGSFALTKQKYANNLLTYPEAVKKTEKQKSTYIIENTKYLIGIDRGENTLICASVYDIESMKLIHRETLGEKFKTTIAELKLVQSELRSKFSAPSKIRKADSAISGKIKHFVDVAMGKLVELALRYQFEAKKESKYCALVFESIQSDFKRQGSRAYVELNQMHKMIKTIRDNRNFYELGFHIFEISPAFTSQICKMCGHIDAKNRTGESFLCLGCGHSDHADQQAADNILIKWLAYKHYIMSEQEKKTKTKDHWQMFTRSLHRVA